MAAIEALNVVKEEPERFEKLHENAKLLNAALLNIDKITCPRLVALLNISDEASLLLRLGRLSVTARTMKYGPLDKYVVLTSFVHRSVRCS